MGPQCLVITRKRSKAFYPRLVDNKESYTVFKVKVEQQALWWRSSRALIPLAEGCSLGGAADPCVGWDSPSTDTGWVGIDGGRP